jgi:hypothetical protein
LTTKNSQAAVSSQLLHERLLYDPDTGALTWRTPERDRFATLNAFTTWRTRFAGRPAGKRRDDGYVTVRVTVAGDTHAFLAHRIIWCMVHGQWPEGQIDHINGNRADNRPSNLRDVSAAMNRLNMKCPKSSTTGVPGVSWCRVNRRWLVRINVDQRTKNLGRYDDFDQAVAVRKAAEQTYGYHANHGARTTLFDLEATPTTAYTESRPRRRRPLDPPR